MYLLQVPVTGKGGKMDQIPLKPPWVVILNYEYELRKEAIKRAFRDSRPLRETLREVTDDAQLKEQYFTAPIALQNRGKRGSDQWDGQHDDGKWHRDTWRKGAGWGKGTPRKGDDKGRGDQKGKDKKGKDPKGPGKGKRENSNARREVDLL